VANQPDHPVAPRSALSARRISDGRLLDELLDAVAERVADKVGARIPPVALAPIALDRSNNLLRRQEDAAKACGLALTEFKKRLRRGEVPAIYEDGTPQSYDADTLRLWALSQYPPFDRSDPAAWMVWLYSTFGLNVLGGRLAA